MMHAADKLFYDPGRQKCTTENHLKALLAVNAAKRSRSADNGATQVHQAQDDTTAAQSQDMHDGASQDGGNASETEGHAMDDDGI